MNEEMDKWLEEAWRQERARRKALYDARGKQKCSKCKHMVTHLFTDKITYCALSNRKTKRTGWCEKFKEKEK